MQSATSGPLFWYSRSSPSAQSWPVAKHWSPCKQIPASPLLFSSSSLRLLSETSDAQQTSFRYESIARTAYVRYSGYQRPNEADFNNWSQVSVGCPSITFKSAAVGCLGRYYRRVFLYWPRRHSVDRISST